MLVLSRKIDEDINIFVCETKIVIRVVEIDGNKVRLGLTAPRDKVRIERGELTYARVAQEEAAKAAAPPCS